MNTTLSAGRLAVAAACIAWPLHAAHAASFDCNQASTAIEVTVCGVPALSQLDERLAALHPDAAQQRQWVQTVRDQCADQECLQSAYEQRIQALESVAGAHTQTHEQAHEQANEPARNPLDLMMDVTWFYGLPDVSLSDIVTREDGVLFGKRVLDWTDEDFALLAQRLKQQLAVEREEAAARQDKIKAMGYQPHPVEEDHDYAFHKGVLDKVAKSIPKYRYLIAETRRKAADDHAAAAAAQQKQEAARQDEAARQAAAAQEREQQQAADDAERGRSNKTVIVLALLGAAVGGWVWNKFFRLRCARCKSTDIETLAVDEQDRWRGSKKVTEQTTRGTKTRHVSATFVKNQYHYQCRGCGEDWLVVKKEEL